MGFASSPATRSALAPYGIRVTGYRWRWGLGLKGGTFPPHYHQNGEYASDSGDFEALPGEDVNGDACMCALVPQYRDSAGRFARPGLAPVFQPPVTASLPAPQQLDLTPLSESLERLLRYTLAQDAPLVNVNVPEFQLAPVTNVEAPNVTVDPTFHVEAPAVHVDGPTVNVPENPVSVFVPEQAAPVVNVEAPNVTVNPEITVQPAQVKFPPQPKRETRLIFDDEGHIIGMKEV